MPAKTVKSHFQDYYMKRRQTGITYGIGFAILSLLIIQVLLQIFQDFSEIVITASLGYGLGFFGSAQRYDTKNKSNYAYYCSIDDTFNFNYRNEIGGEENCLSLNFDTIFIEVVDDLLCVYFKQEGRLNLLIIKRLPDYYSTEIPEAQMEPFYENLEKLRTTEFNQDLLEKYGGKIKIEDLTDGVDHIYSYLGDQLLRFEKDEYDSVYNDIVESHKIPEDKRCRVSCLKQIEQEGGDQVNTIPGW